MVPWRSSPNPLGSSLAEEQMSHGSSCNFQLQIQMREGSNSRRNRSAFISAVFLVSYCAGIYSSHHIWCSQEGIWRHWSTKPCCSLHWLQLDPSREGITITQSCKLSSEDQTQTASLKAPLNVSAEAVLPSNLHPWKIVDILPIVPAVMRYALAPAALG